MNNKIEALLKLIKENPELPIVPFVDCDVVSGDDYGRWLGSFGYSEVGEYALYDDRYYDDRESFKEDYYSWNDDELCETFDYEPAICEYSVARGLHTEEQLNRNKQNGKALDEYLDKLADKYFIKAILVNIDLPEE